MKRIAITPEQIAQYIIENGATRAQAAAHFGIAVNSVYRYIDKLTGELKEQVDAIAKENRKKKPATICESGESVITVTEKSEVPAAGHRVGGNAHPLIDLTTGTVYSSGIDAAENLGVTQASVSWAVTGKSSSCKGHKFIKVSDAQSNISAISNAIKTANARTEAAEGKAQADIVKAKSEAASEINVIRAKAEYEAELAQAQLNELRMQNALLTEALTPIEAIKATRAALAEHRAKAEELHAEYEAELRAIEEAESQLVELIEAL